MMRIMHSTKMVVFLVIIITTIIIMLYLEIVKITITGLNVVVMHNNLWG